MSCKVPNASEKRGFQTDKQILEAEIVNKAVPKDFSTQTDVHPWIPIWDREKLHRRYVSTQIVSESIIQCIGGNKLHLTTEPNSTKSSTSHINPSYTYIDTKSHRGVLKLFVSIMYGLDKLPPPPPLPPDFISTGCC